MEAAPSKACILGALSQALDLVEGQIEGHALRTCLIALRLGRDLGLSNAELEDLYFSAVLKDAGCSNNSVRIQKIFGGDELLSKRKVKFIDWSSPAQSLKFAVLNTEPGNSIAMKLRRMAQNVGPPAAIMDEVTEARCTRGAFIARKLNFTPTVAQTILCLDEHWDGRGAPMKVKGENIPILARILCLSQTFEVFLSAYGLQAAREVAEKRKGKWFDPQVVQAVCAIGEDDELWANLRGKDLIELAGSELPWLSDSAIETDVDGICEAFAMIIDAKSSFTAQHSDRVTTYAVQVGKWLGLEGDRLTTLRRACLMHDIGKLGVSTSILEKPGKLDDGEFQLVKLHPMFSHIILSRIPTFGEMAYIASAHHERLDGKGYWMGLKAEQLTLDVRIATVCDVFDALTANRPYREAMPVEKALGILEREIGSAFDPDCVRAVRECFGNSVQTEVPLAA